MTNNTNELKNRLLDYIESITIKCRGTSNQYVCPLCGSGTGANHTGAFTYYPKSDSFYCFSCHVGGNIFNLYAEMNNLSTDKDFPQIIRELEDMFSLSHSTGILQPPKPTKISTPEQTKKDFLQLFKTAEQQLNQTDYLTKRGISPRIQHRFHCGYVPNFMYKNNQTTPAIIIPTSDSSYMWRSTTENIKQKRGQVHIFNPEALKNQYCFVVEGEIDCMSLVECCYSCIGLGSTSNIKRIFEHDTSNTVLIIAMDNDRAGIEATRKLEQLCIEHQTPYITAPESVWGDCKDANELLMKDCQALSETLYPLMQQAIELDREEWLEQTQNRSESDIPWQDTLQRNTTNNQLKNNLQNIYTIFTNDEEYKDKIEFNELSQMLTFDRQDWKDVIEHLMRFDLEKRYSLYTSIESISQVCSIIAHKRHYHPIQEYLISVQWDGIPRIKTVFSDFLGATNNKYTQAVATVTFVGAVARIFQAGIKYDTCTVFVGKQGTGKSKFIFKIAHNSEWFTDSVTTFDGKEFYESILGKWIIELGEGTAFQKSVKERCKQAIASQQDHYRKPYGRNPEVRKRQCIFIGTTNNYDFLKDETGDRRYYPIDVNISHATKNIDRDLTDEYVSQLWAEAVYLYNKGQSIYIQDDEVLTLAEQEQRKHFDESPLQADIFNFLEIPITKDWYSSNLDSRRLHIKGYQNGNQTAINAGAYKRDRVSVKEIACELYGYELNQPIDRRMSLEIARTLTALGWINTGKREHLSIYGLQRMFYK